MSLSMIFWHKKPPSFDLGTRSYFSYGRPFCRIYREALVVIFLKAPHIRLGFASLTPHLHLQNIKTSPASGWKFMQKCAKQTEVLIKAVGISNFRTCQPQPDITSQLRLDEVILRKCIRSIPKVSLHLSAWSRSAEEEKNFPRQFDRNRWRKSLCIRIRRLDQSRRVRNNPFFFSHCWCNLQE